MSYNFTKKIQVGKFEIQVDDHARYGWFEHEDLGDEAGGGLWFGYEHDHYGERTSDTRLHLDDYDGMSCLPKQVTEGLRALGYVVDEVFE